MNLKVGDKVRIKENLSECEFGYNRYMEEFAGKKATVIRTFGKGGIELDIDKHTWCWSENVLELIEEGKTMKMKRIDYILNVKNPIKVLVEEFDLDLKCCGCHYYNGCDVCNANCDVAFIEYLKQDIEVNESDLKDADVESITIGQALQSIYDMPPQIKINSDKIKEVNVDNENDNMNMKIEERNRINKSDLKDSEISKEVENDNVKMKRIDYILNARDNIQAILDETVLDCDICPASCENCNGNCEFHYKKYLNEEIEVDKSKLKLVEENIKVETVECDKEVVNNPVNPFIEEYKKIVTETMNLCEKKNKDYGNATDESFKQFGDVSYQVRCFDKWSRINTLLKNGKAEVSESLEDSLLDLSNYLFLWVTSRRLKEKGDTICQEK